MGDFEEDMSEMANDPDLAENLKELLSDDIALNFLSDKVPMFKDMGRDEMMMLLIPMLGLVQKYGVDVVSMGDEERAAKVTGATDQINTAISILRDFMPHLRTIYGMMKNKKSGSEDIDMSDDEWDAVSTYDTGEEAEPSSPSDNSADFLDTAKRDFSSQGSKPQRTNPNNPFTWEACVQTYREMNGDKNAVQIMAELSKDGIQVQAGIGPSQHEPEDFYDRVRKDNVEIGADGQLIEQGATHPDDAIGYDNTIRELQSFTDPNSMGKLMRDLQMAQEAEKQKRQSETPGEENGVEDISQDMQSRLDSMPVVQLDDIDDLFEEDIPEDREYYDDEDEDYLIEDGE